MTATDPMPSIETSWGSAPWIITETEPDDRGGVRTVEHYAGTFWTVYCLRHDQRWDANDERDAEAFAANPDHFCVTCEFEWDAWAGRNRPFPTDLESDSALELRSLTRAEERDDMYSEDGVAR